MDANMLTKLACSKWLLVHDKAKYKESLEINLFFQSPYPLRAFIMGIELMAIKHSNITVRIGNSDIWLPRNLKDRYITVSNTYHSKSMKWHTLLHYNCLNVLSVHDCHQNDFSQLKNKYILNGV